MILHRNTYGASSYMISLMKTIAVDLLKFSSSNLTFGRPG